MKETEILANELSFWNSIQKSLNDISIAIDIKKKNLCILENLRSSSDLDSKNNPKSLASMTSPQMTRRPSHTSESIGNPRLDTKVAQNKPISVLAKPVSETNTKLISKDTRSTDSSSRLSNNTDLFVSEESNKDDNDASETTNLSPDLEDPLSDLGVLEGLEDDTEITDKDSLPDILKMPDDDGLSSIDNDDDNDPFAGL